MVTLCNRENARYERAVQFVRKQITRIMDMKARHAHLRKKTHIFLTMRLIKKLQKGMIELPCPDACCLI